MPVAQEREISMHGIDCLKEKLLLLHYAGCKLHFQGKLIYYEQNIFYLDVDSEVMTLNKEEYILWPY